MKPAFSVIELLLVAGIISILVAIAVPNYLDAQVRAQVTQVRLDLNRVEGALHYYHLDTNRYPPAYGLNHLENGPWLSGRPAYDRFKEGPSIAFPTQYLDYGYMDLSDRKLADNNRWMGKTTAAVGLQVPRNTNQAWVLSSVGPERKMTLVGSRLTPYDPTNGVISPGKVFRVGLP